MVQFEDVSAARDRIKVHLKTTPILTSSLLNRWLGHTILFKAECLQTTGSFKFRGALSVLSRLAQHGTLPKKVVANSSGNHAQAVAYASSLFNVPAHIFAGKSISQIKAQATQHYGAKLSLFDTRELADEAVKQASVEAGTLWIPPFNHQDIIAGQGTLLLDSFQQCGEVDAVFAPCGGGGLLSGTLISARHLMPSAKVIGCEPLAANDAAQSLRAGKIQSLSVSPKTLADGAATPSVGSITFPFLQQVDELYEISEEDIVYWTQWLQHLLKIHVEPTCAMSMSGVKQWLQQQTSSKTVLVMLTGGNIDNNKMLKIWQSDALCHPPTLT